MAQLFNVVCALGAHGLGGVGRGRASRAKVSESQSLCLVKLFPQRRDLGFKPTNIGDFVVVQFLRNRDGDGLSHGPTRKLYSIAPMPQCLQTCSPPLPSGWSRQPVNSCL